MPRKKKDKEPERKVASFREHWNFYSVPFLVTTTALPLVYSFLSWVINYREHVGNPDGLMAMFWLPITISALLTYLYFFPRIKLLTCDNYYKEPGLQVMICFLGHSAIFFFTQKALVDLMNRSMEDNWIYPVIAHIVTNVLWLIFTYIPVLELDKLRKFQEKRRRRI